MGVALPLVLGLLTRHPLLGLGAAIGALPVGFASRQGVYRTRAASMLLTAAGMGVSAFAGAVTGESALLAIAAAGVWGLVFGLLGSLGPSTTAVGLNSCIALAIFSQFHDSPEQAALQGGLVFAGGALQTLLLVLVWPLQRFSEERRVLAKAYRELAGYAASSGEGELERPGSKALSALGETLADPQPFARRGATAAFEVLLDEAGRIRATLGALAVDRYALAHAGRTRAAEALRALGGATHNILVEIASALEEARAPVQSEPWHAIEESLGRVEREAGEQTAADAQALAGQLRSAWYVACTPEHGVVSPAEVHAAHPRYVAPLSESLRTLRANLSPHSEYAQYAIRFALTLMAATAASRAFTVERGYWAPLTAALVLKPDFGATFSRGVARILGTLIGAVVAASIVAVFHPGQVSYLVLSLLFAAASFVVFDASYAAFTVAITGYVVFVLAYGGLPEQRALIDRIEATLVGGSIALGAYVVWPTWERARAPARLAGLLDRQRAYLVALADALLDSGRRPSDDDKRALAAAQAAVWLARTNAEASVDRLVNEPVAPRDVTTRATLGILAASRRLGLASLALSARLSSSAPWLPQAEFAALENGLSEALGSLATSLREHTVPAEFPPLRDAHGRLAKAVAAHGDAGGAGIVAETDIMVDALDTMRDLLVRLREEGPTKAGHRAEGGPVLDG